MSTNPALLQLLYARGLGPKSFRRLLLRLAGDNYPVADFVAAPTSHLVRDFGLSMDTAREIREACPLALQTLEELERYGIGLLAAGAKGYPEKLARRLGDDSPPLLFVRGPVEVIEGPSVGVCGSRDASDDGMQFAADCAEALGRRGINVVAGYAAGIDTAAHIGALASDGATTAVLATGILHFQLKPELAVPQAEENILVLSEFPPSLGWSASGAMRRNTTVCGLSDALLVVESGLSGGTYDAARTALRREIPLFVARLDFPEGHGEGNPHFADRGGRWLGRGSDGAPDLDELRASLASGGPPTQTSLL